MNCLRVFARREEAARRWVIHLVCKCNLAQRDKKKKHNNYLLNSLIYFLRFLSSSEYFSGLVKCMMGMHSRQRSWAMSNDYGLEEAHTNHTVRCNECAFIHIKKSSYCASLGKSYGGSNWRCSGLASATITPILKLENMPFALLGWTMWTSTLAYWPNVCTLHMELRTPNAERCLPYLLFSFISASPHLCMHISCSVATD